MKKLSQPFVRPVAVALFLLVAATAAAAPPQTVVTRTWKALWIDVPGSLPQEYGVYHFRKVITLSETPARFVIHVSGDNRYQLLVNGTWVSTGPARGDLTHWRYETVDIAPQLHTGRNVVSAVVWNDGPLRAVAQISNQTGFVLEADDPANATLNTGRSWKCMRDTAYTAQPLPPQQNTGYYALGPNEHFDAGKYAWGWSAVDFDDSTWADAHEMTHAADRDARDAPNRWMMVERAIPQEERTEEKPLTVRRAEGAAIAPGAVVSSLQIAPNTSATVLLDQQHLTTAYPRLTVSGGANAEVELHYAEALFDPNTGREHRKSNRNEIEGKVFLGPFDTYVSDGGDHRVYEPLFWRTYRYLQLSVKTGAAPLTIDSVGGTFTAYPFKAAAAFEAPQAPKNDEIQRILATGWHTARLCAHESYMDCPFYEQLQYAGDARIQMLVSLYMTGDARLMKNGIGLLNSSRTAEGATYSRAPSNLQQYIPPFSLWWIGMVHDYWMYVDDPAFVRDMLPGVHAVLSFYRQYQKENGSLARMPWWNFVDWVREWPTGEPPGDSDHSSAAALDLQLLLAYQWAADLENAFGSKAQAAEDTDEAERLRTTIRQTDWDAARGLFADQPSHRTYSQHVNTLAILAHVVQGKEAHDIAEKMFADPSLAQASIYFRAYTNAALREAGLGDRYLAALDPWRKMLADGLTTWAEVDGDASRSDCHAWGASPNFEFLRTVAGIEPDAPGFASVRVAPHLGDLPSIRATVPHPRGTIHVELSTAGKQLKGTVDLPEGTPGTLIWEGHSHKLHAGSNRVSF